MSYFWANTINSFLFFHLWLNLYTYHAMGHNFKNNQFLSSDFLEEEDATFHCCISFNEATSAFPARGADVTQSFKSFYHGFTQDTTFWFAYNDADMIHAC